MRAALPSCSLFSSSGPTLIAVFQCLIHTQVLEMRECGLRSVPASLVALPALHSLLMGYNFMNEVGREPRGWVDSLNLGCSLIDQLGYSLMTLTTTWWGLQ